MRAGELISGVSRLSLGDRGPTRCCPIQLHRVPPPSPTQALRDFLPSLRPLRGRASALPTLALRAFRVPPHSGSCALVTPDSLTAIASFATQRVACLSFGDSTNSSPSSSPPPPTRRLRPAGQRPASRRLSRSPSAPERTIHVLHRRRWGRTAVLSGAEAARRSHKRLAGRRPSSATLRPFFSRAAPVICSISSRARRGKYKREVRFGLSLTRNSCSAFIHAVQLSV